MILSLDIPEHELERARQKWEAARARRMRYEAKSGRGRHDLNDSRPKGHEREVHYRDYRFVGWDGEAPKDTGYSLFGSSDGDEICKPGLHTEDCLDLLLEAKERDPQTIFVWFGGRYDWDEILRHDMPMRALARLKSAGTVHWRGYRLTETEGKFYTVTKDGVSVTVYEIHGWFHKRYAAALRDYGVGTAAELDYMEAEKNRRSEFLWSEIEEIREYFRLELRLMPVLMDRIRDICAAAGFNPRGWYGPSALARELLTRHKISDYMSECPEEVNRAACYAFAGGRFEPFRGGLAGSNATADQNSAYMHAALALPDLSAGQWRHGMDFEPGKFAVYRIKYRYKGVPNALRPNPLFRRLRNGSVCWPNRVEGWYWTPEAELVANDPDAEFLEAWIFDEANSAVRPFTFVRELFAHRQTLKRLPEGNPSRQAEMAFKWALASIYGQLARRVGWDRKNRKPPPTHQIEWAGYITSACRAEMYRLAVACGDRLISIDTDSVTAMGDMSDAPVKLGNELGEWKLDTADAGVFFQSGVFFTQSNGKWSKGKSRGIEQRRKTPDLTPDMLTEAIAEDKAVKLTPRRKYTTVKMALAGVPARAGEWKEHPGNVLTFGGGGKRYHNKMMCWKYCDAEHGIHGFIPAFNGDNIFDIQSYPHMLPWKEQGKRAAEVFTDTLWVDTESIDDELWYAELIEKYGATNGNEDARSIGLHALMHGHTVRDSYPGTDCEYGLLYWLRSPGIHSRSDLQ